MRLMFRFHDRDWWIVVPKKRKEETHSTTWPLMEIGRCWPAFSPKVNCEFFGFGCIED
jgi:hypothetical protein